MSRDHPRDVTRVNQKILIEQKAIEREKSWMMRKAVKRFQPLSVVVSIDAHADVGAHLLSGNFVDCVEIDEPAKRILSGLSPAMTIDNTEQLRAKGEDIFARDESFEEKVAMLLRALEEGDTITE
jgi:hypothetical protein